MGQVKTENIEMEYGILFSIFKFKGEALKKILKFIDHKTFSMEMNRKIFYHLVKKYNESGVVLSISGIEHYMAGLNQIGSDDVPIIKTVLEHVKHHKMSLCDVEISSKQLNEMYVVRKLFKTLTTKTQNLANDNLEDVLYEIEKEVLGFRKELSKDLAKNVGYLKAGLDEREQYMLDTKNNPVAQGKVKTGLSNFDRFISGLTPGQFAIFIAKSGEGKSMMLMRTATENFKAGVKTIIITIEMNQTEYLQRIDSSLSGHKHEKFTSGILTDDNTKIQSWKTSVQQTGEPNEDLIVYYVPENCTPATVDLIIENCPFKPQLVIVDYAGDMSSGMKGVSNYDFKSQSEIFKSLKELAGKHQLVIFTAQQVQRGLKKLDKESGSLTKVATERSDMVISFEIEEEGSFEVNGSISTLRYLAKMVKYRHGRGLETYFIEMFERMSIYEIYQDRPMYANIGYLGKKKSKEDKDKKQEDKLKDAQSKVVSSSEIKSEVPENILDQYLTAS